MQVLNKKASFEYELTPEKVEAGVVLKGIEAKSFRDGRVDISQSHVRIMDGEAFLINANIPAGDIKGYEPTRMRKLLLHKNQIVSLSTKMKQKKLQIVPVSMYNTDSRIKLELVLGVPKRKFDKKESIKKHDVQRDIDRELRGKD
ncbi:MAG: SsrA-binding protein SmpB [Microgenomates group bacterium]